jgi:predicted metalloendopeptidase
MYNQQGKLEEWWTNATIKGFKVKEECIVEQFSCTLLSIRKLLSLGLIEVHSLHN